MHTTRNNIRTTSSTLAKEVTTKQLKHLRNLATVSSSQTSYATVQHCFLKFWHTIRVSPLPASKETIALFAAALNHTLATSSIKGYLAAVSLLHRKAGIRSPTWHNPALQLALGEILRQHSVYARKTRLPITKIMLNHILTHLQKCCKWSQYDRTMLSAALSLAFYGFLHASKFTTPSQHSFNPYCHPTTQNISVSSSRVSFIIKRSKTDQAAQGYTITLHATGRKLYPVRLITRYYWQWTIFAN